MIATTLIKVPSWGTVTLLEAIWLSSGILALCFTLSHVRPLFEDWISVARANKPVLTELAWGYLRRELIRVVQGICLTSLGAYAAWEPNPLPGPARISPVGIVLTAILMLLAFLVSAQSYWDWRTRDQVQDLIREGNGISHQPKGA